MGRGQEAGDRGSDPPRHHQGEPADPLVLLGGLVPGDDPRPHRAAVQGKVDPLEGLKENIIVGRLIPAGTGGMIDRPPADSALKRDELIVAAEGGRRRSMPANTPALEGPQSRRVSRAKSRLIGTN